MLNAFTSFILGSWKMIDRSLKSPGKIMEIESAPSVCYVLKNENIILGLKVIGTEKNGVEDKRP